MTNHPKADLFEAQRESALYEECIEIDEELSFASLLFGSNLETEDSETATEVFISVDVYNGNCTHAQKDKDIVDTGTSQ